MPLPLEALEEIRTRMEAAEKSIKVIEEIITDKRAAGIDASKEEERLAPLKDDLRKWKVFYERQAKRPQSE